jgi:hypothetical protein
VQLQAAAVEAGRPELPGRVARQVLPPQLSRAALKDRQFPEIRAVKTAAAVDLQQPLCFKWISRYSVLPCRHGLRFQASCMYW